MQNNVLIYVAYVVLEQSKGAKNTTLANEREKPEARDYHITTINTQIYDNDIKTKQKIP